MEDSDFVQMIYDFEKDHIDIVKSWKEEIGKGKDQGHIVKVLEETSEKMRSNLFYLFKFLWIIIRYSDKTHGLIREYLNSRINHSPDTRYNASLSLRNVFESLAEKGIIHSDNIDDIRIENVLKNTGDTKEINSLILDSIKPKLKNPGSKAIEERSFADLLSGDCKTELFNWLKKEFSGTKGKSIAIMIISLWATKRLKKMPQTVLLKAIKKDFGNIGTYQSVNDYLTPYETRNQREGKHIITEEDLQPFIDRIKTFSCK